MPYLLKKGSKTYYIPRITEIAQTLSCEATAYFHPIHQRRIHGDRWEEIHKSYEVRNNLRAICGTLAHGEIENFIRAQMGLSPEPVILSPSDNDLLKKLMTNKERFRIFLNEKEIPVNNFYQWWTDNKDNIRIIGIEKKIRNIITNEDGTIDELNSTSGTIDFLALYKIENVGWRLLIIDWKSGFAALPTHYLQLCGYYELLVNSKYYKELMDDGLLEENPYLFRNGKPMVLCVLLGGNTYFEKWYEVKVEDFQRARKKFRDPKNITLDHGTNKVGNKGFCRVCGYERLCGEFGFYPPEYPEITDYK